MSTGQRSDPRPRDGRLVNQYATKHNQAVAGGIPILALDMYEHAYALDYGAYAKACVDILMRNVDWKALHARYEEAAKVGGLWPLEQPEFGHLASVGPEQVKAMLDSGEAVQIVDARMRASLSWTQEVMQGANWRDPDASTNGPVSSRSLTPSSCSAPMAFTRGLNRDQAAGYRVRCEVHARWSLRMERHRRLGQTARLTVRPCSRRREADRQN